ncbi:MAG: alpha/beta hydrolase [Gemmatimonadaceae bacterium]
MVSIITIVMAVALVWVLVTTVWMWRYQERVVFQPPAVSVDAPAPARRVEFKASDNHQLFGYVVAPGTPGTPGTPATTGTPANPVAPLPAVPPPGQSRGPLAGRAGRPETVVIAFHGNADLAAWTVPWAHELAERAGVTVFVPEFRGYAGIPGLPTYASAAADARGALEFVRTVLQPRDIVLYGHSLGSALATELAAHMRPQSPSALVLVSPFTSARDMATRMLVPPIPGVWGMVSRVHYDTRALVANLDAPVFVSHGSRDLNIPARMGRQVFAAARHPADLLIIEGAGHNDVADVGGERYWRWLVKAVTRDSAPVTRAPQSRLGAP